METEHTTAAPPVRLARTAGERFHARLKRRFVCRHSGLTFPRFTQERIRSEFHDSLDVSGGVQSDHRIVHGLCVHHRQLCRCVRGVGPGWTPHACFHHYYPYISMSTHADSASVPHLHLPVPTLDGGHVPCGRPVILHPGWIQ